MTICCGDEMETSLPYKSFLVLKLGPGSVKMPTMTQATEVVTLHSAKYAIRTGGPTCIISWLNIAKRATNVNCVQRIEIKFQFSLNIRGRYYVVLILTQSQCQRGNMD